MKTSSIATLFAGAALVLNASAASVPGDPVRGEVIYGRCVACHAFAYDRTGPRHCGLFGRRAGGVPGFAYSDAMRRSNWVWNAQTLDRFLQSPLKALPGTSMGYAGIADRQERTDLIAYLKRMNDSAECGRQ